ncbi:Quino protein alcohol dehydrogenase-like protein [Bimuria novae-zelandiae CBS 107.79]|uniref:Quino protein alcohol dehydrogenase-like protein n=1 Tax=Bimuria novae-zelandiae CBS 107.79 TaxID=1447943 RepID=A0A6A5VQK1_9PLEO|nr:Quino protein alcohol dehydrogenase-like protein [Bimuria novae-zelandiae CBS 107.79]
MRFSILSVVLSLFFSAQAHVLSNRQSLTADSLSTQWTGWGGNHYNNRWAAQNKVVSSRSVLSAVEHCNVSYPIGVSATPVISDNVAYFPTWNGSFVALNYQNCRTLWSINVTSIIASYAPITTFQAANTRPVSRTSPQIEGNTVYFGTLTHALVVAVDKRNGRTLGIVRLSSIPVAVITMSPTIYHGSLFVGTSSVETSTTKLAGYQCCSFVGEMFALRFNEATKTFEIQWSVKSIPDTRHAEGWAGAAFWGSQPSIDAIRRQVFVGTGNSYLSSNASVQCQKDTTPAITPYTLHDDECLPKNVWQDSILAINIDNGEVNWVQQRPGVDLFQAGCGYPNKLPQNPAVCPGIPGTNSDFGMAPTYVPSRDAIIVGRKNGDLHAISAENGKIQWTTSTGPNGVNGGLSWGIAVDDTQIYFTVINSDYDTWQLQPSGESVNRSAYGAASLSDGKILWQTAVPQNGISMGPPTVVGDVVLVARTGQDPTGASKYDQSQGGLVALNKSNGKVVIDRTLTTNFHGGVAVDGPFILFGTGYSGPGAAALVPGGFQVLKVRR